MKITPFPFIFLTLPAKLSRISTYAPVAQQDTPPAGGVQMATEQSEALGHLLSVRRVSDSFGIFLFFSRIHAPVAHLDRAYAS